MRFKNSSVRVVCAASCFGIRFGPLKAVFERTRSVKLQLHCDRLPQFRGRAVLEKAFIFVLDNLHRASGEMVQETSGAPASSIMTFALSYARDYQHSHGEGIGNRGGDGEGLNPVGGRK